jgi:hypothetical protein
VQAHVTHEQPPCDAAARRADDDQVAPVEYRSVLQRVRRRGVAEGVQPHDAVGGNVPFRRVQPSDRVIAQAILEAAERTSRRHPIGLIRGDEVELVRPQRAGKGDRVSATLAAVDADDRPVEHGHAPSAPRCSSTRGYGRGAGAPSGTSTSRCPEMHGAPTGGSADARHGRRP